MRVAFDQPVNDVTDSSVPVCSCGDKQINPAFYDSIWDGEIDRKAISRSAALYPQTLKAAHVRDVVAVSVLIDQDGKVLWAQSISGHPLLRQSAQEAACHARFAPSLIDRTPLTVSGILTYRFGL